MKVSLNWLKQYVEIDVPVAVLCDKMIMSGFEVESVENLSDTMRNVVVGKIVRLEKHPDADKLQICHIDIGTSETVQIVTGATNVFEGALVPAALHDSQLPCGLHIKKGKLRGVLSSGMLCSGGELCLKEVDFPGAEVDGILMLPADSVPGTDMRAVLQLDDTVIDFKITANRPDCQSVLGIAREVAVVLNRPFTPPVPVYHTKGGHIREHIQVSVEDTALCSRYMGRVVKNLRIAPSPDWMKHCLKTAGMRPINNIVDITNFVMLETGYPMHPFDMREIAGSQITVRRATAGEHIRTLDEKEHTLTPDMLVIADAKAPSCLAGIMGGAHSEIQPDTVDLFLECAKFRRENIRRTARTLGMRTESSARFEKGVDVQGVAFAMERALQLIDELDAGDIIDGVIDCHLPFSAPRSLSVTADSISQLLGVEIPAPAMADILNRLGIATTLESGVLHCLVPSFRDDVEGRADLAEEIMRIYGYDHIHSTPMRGTITRGQRLPERRHTDHIKTLLIENRLREITTYSFINNNAADTLLLAENDPRRRAIALLNPLGEDCAVLRTQLITSMLTVMATNISRKIPAARFFEVNKLFLAKEWPIVTQPEEVPALCLGLYGKEEDFFTLKGIVETIFAAFNVSISYTASDEPYFHPGRQAAALCGEEPIAVFGEIHPSVMESYAPGTRVYVAQLLLRPLFAAGTPALCYKPLPRFPSIERDLALLCDKTMPVAEIESCIRQAGGKQLEHIELFDVYQGAQIPADKKSVAYNLVFRWAEGTLTEEQISPVLSKIFKHLNEKGCILRT